LTARGELFVTEDVRDVVIDELRKAGLLKENEWVEVECPNEWRDKWSASEYPEGGEARIYEETEDGREKYVGEVEWRTDFYVESDFGAKYVDAEPVITRLEYKGRVVIKEDNESSLIRYHVTVEVDKTEFQDINEANAYIREMMERICHLSEKNGYSMRVVDVNIG